MVNRYKDISHNIGRTNSSERRWNVRPLLAGGRKLPVVSSMWRKRGEEGRSFIDQLFSLDEAHGGVMFSSGKDREGGNRRLKEGKKKNAYLPSNGRDSEALIHALRI